MKVYLWIWANPVTLCHVHNVRTWFYEYCITLLILRTASNAVIKARRSAQRRNVTSGEFVYTQAPQTINKYENCFSRCERAYNLTTRRRLQSLARGVCFHILYIRAQEVRWRNSRGHLSEKESLHACRSTRWHAQALIFAYLIGHWIKTINKSNEGN